MQAGAILSYEARVYIHATEDREKVLKAIMEVVPEELRKEVRVEEERYEGHYGNPIIVATVKLEDPKAALKAARYLLSRMSSFDRMHLRNSLDERIDRNGVVHIRVSKQEAYLGRIVVYESDDVVKIMIRFAGGRSRALKSFLELLDEAQASKTG